MAPASLPAVGGAGRIRQNHLMAPSRIPDPIESVRHQLRPLFDQIVIKELDSDRVRRSGLAESVRAAIDLDEAGDEVPSPSASVGWAVFPDDGQDFETLMRSADDRMLRIKRDDYPRVS